MDTQTIFMYLAGWSILGLVIFHMYGLYIEHKLTALEKLAAEGDHSAGEICKKCGKLHNLTLTNGERIAAAITIIIGGPLVYIRTIYGYWKFRVERRRRRQKIMLLSMLQALKEVIEEESDGETQVTITEGKANEPPKELKGDK